MTRSINGRTLCAGLALTFFGMLCLPGSSRAAGWSGIISPERAADWSRAGIPGGIPKRTTIYVTLAPGATAEDINRAIASCPSGQVVLLGAGTYTLSAAIDFADHSDVTLRGAGADQTSLVFAEEVERRGIRQWRGINADICIENLDASLPHGVDNDPDTPDNTADWTGGYSQGATEIALSSTANLVAGKSIICLDQLDDSDTDTGAIWVNLKKNVSSVEGAGGDGGRRGRVQMQMSRVTGIHGNRVIISPGLYMPNWRSGQKPGAWWASEVVSGDGVEDLSIDHLRSGAESGILLFNAYQCWVKGVRVVTSNRSHVWLYLTSHSVVRDSYFYGTRHSIQLSYGVELNMAADSLVENNIFQHIVSPMISNGSASGTVWGYNYAVDDYYVKSPEWFMPSFALHSAGTEMMLMEGNDSTGLVGDYIHGTHHLITAFRNQFIGWEPGKSKNTSPVYLYTGSRYFNLIGNVLGKLGYHSHYEDLAPDGTDGNASIYTVGWSGNEGRVYPLLKNDPKSAETLLRWGNYDTVNHEAQWRPSEVPSGIGELANPVPADHRLPASFYLSGKPAWWGAMPWPAIGPDVTGGNDPTGHVYANPAEVCYRNAPRDDAYPEDPSGNRLLVFNADRYYYTDPHTRRGRDAR